MTSRKAPQKAPPTFSELEPLGLLLLKSVLISEFAPPGYNHACRRLRRRLQPGREKLPTSDEFEQALAALTRAVSIDSFPHGVISEQREALWRAEQWLAQAEEEARARGLIAGP